MTTPATSEEIRMKFGMHTILWGPTPTSFEGMLEFIHDLGLKGVEVFQHPRQIAKQVGGPERFRSLLERFQLELIGLCSGTLCQRIDFCEEAHLKPGYLYVDEWDDSIPDALEKEYCVALHPHVYKLPTLSAAFDLLRRDSRLRLIIDPAHLTVGGQDPIEAINRHYSSLIAVHLKDWGPWFGRSFHRYAQGFTELGSGSVPIKSFLATLKDRGFGGWAILEQDSKTSTPEASVRKSLKWLAENGYYDPKLVVRMLPPSRAQVEVPREVNFGPRTMPLVDALARAPDTPDLFPEIVVRGFQAWANCRLTRLWAYCPSQRALTLVASHPAAGSTRLLKVDSCLCGRAIDHGRITFVADVTKPDGKRSFQDLALAKELGLKSMLSVPIFNRHNPNHVELQLNLFLDAALDDTLERDLPFLSDYVALSAERILADRCARVTGAIQELFTECKTKDKFLKSCLPIILDAVSGEAATIFVQNTPGKELLVAASTGIQWAYRQGRRGEYYEPGQGRTGTVWKENVDFLDLGLVPGTAHDDTSWETATGPLQSILLVPVRDYTGKAIGVVRCRNKKTEDTTLGTRSFSQEDATVLQAICDAIVPPLLLLQGEENTRLMLAKLAHELKMPLVGINAQLDFIEAESARQRVEFSEDWINEARDSTTLMALLVENAEATVWNSVPESREERVEHLFLLKDVIAPAIDQMKAQLHRFNLRRNSITYFGFDAIPPMWIRPSAIRQVVFNLLSNAIKYRYKDPNAFNVDIVAERLPDWFAVHFSNTGPGIDEKDAETIFDLGVRGSRATEFDVSGQGFGLSISRQLMRQHGGDLVLTRLGSPTTFTMLFPRSIATKRRV